MKCNTGIHRCLLYVLFPGALPSAVGCRTNKAKAAGGKGLHSGVAGVGPDFFGVALVSNPIWVG